MENISINKTKRGRPVKIDQVFKNSLKNTYIETNSSRGHDNNYYLMFGFDLILKAVKEDSIYKFIVNPEKQYHKRTILSEIGRIVISYNDTEALQIAKLICEEKMTTRKAIIYIRNLKGFGKNKVSGILAKICNLINNSLLTKEEMFNLKLSLYYWINENENI